MHHQQSAVNDTLTISRHVAQTINRLINRGVRIDISTEGYTYCLEILNDTFTREMLRTIEGHVLQEVRQTVLMVLFEDSTYTLRNMELATLFGLLIMTDVIGQSVL